MCVYMIVKTKRDPGNSTTIKPIMKDLQQMDVVENSITAERLITGYFMNLLCEVTM